MRIVTIFLALLLSLPAFVSEAGLTVAQKAMRTKMVTFLKEEGYMPEITDEGSIKFKIEGIIYFITLDERDTNPLYYTMSATFNYGDVITRDKMDAIIAEINLYKAIKMTYADNYYSVGSEVYLVDIDQFRYTFYKTKKTIQQALAEIPELAEKVGGESIGSYYTSPATTSSYNYAPPLTLDNLFPVYGYSIGVQLKTLKDAGYKAQKIDKSNYVYIGKNSFWDFDGNKTMESISVKEIPSEWASKWGMTFNWSFNQWKNFLLENDFNIWSEKSEVKRYDYDGRNYLYGHIYANSPDGRFQFIVLFSGGNRNGEGYSIESPASSNNFRVELR